MSLDAGTAADLERLFSTDPAVRTDAYYRVIAATDQPVDWAYQIWDRAVIGLADNNNHVRSVSAQLLCNLAKSDPDGRILRDFDALLQVTRDPRFVTARHCLQNIWKVALTGPEQREVLLAGLQRRYDESVNEKNGTLVRFDILVDLANLDDAAPDPSLKELALGWIEQETDPRYRKKFAGVWKNR